MADILAVNYIVFCSFPSVIVQLARVKHLVQVLLYSLVDNMHIAKYCSELMCQTNMQTTCELHQWVIKTCNDTLHSQKRFFFWLII